jgi:hypothetical protein
MLEDIWQTNGLSHSVFPYVEALRLVPRTVLFKSASFIRKLINKYAAFSSLGSEE